jgi:hypothetical protein
LIDCLEFFAILKNLSVMSWQSVIHYTILQCIWEELTNLHTQSHRSEQDSNRRGLEVRGIVVWDRCLTHSTMEAPETWVVEKCIWCIKIVNVLVLHFNPLVEASAGGLLVPEGLYSPVDKYFVTCFKIRIWIELSKKK